MSPGAERPPCLGPGRTARAPTLTGPAPRPGPSHTASGGLHGHAVGGAAWLRVAVCPGLCPLGLDHPSRSEPPPPPCQAQQGGRTAPPHPSAGLPQSLKSPPQQSGQSWQGKRWPLPQTPTLSHHLPGVLLCHKRGVCYPPPGGAMPAEGQHGPPHRPPAQGGELGSLDPCSVHTPTKSASPGPTADEGPGNADGSVTKPGPVARSKDPLRPGPPPKPSNWTQTQGPLPGRPPLLWEQS